VVYRQQVRARLLIPCTLLLVYLYSFPYFDQLKSANELPRIFLTTEIIDRGTFRIDARYRELGSTFDVSTTPDGHRYSNKAPGLSFLALPSYLVLKGWHAVVGGEPSIRELTWMFRVTAVTVPAVLFLPFFLALARRFAPGCEPAQRTALVAYALGSMAMPYAILLFSHQVAAAFAGASFACAVTLVREHVARRNRWAVAVGALAGASVLVDYQSALAGLAIGVYLLLRSRRRWVDAAWAAAGALPSAILLMIYHAACFGSPLKTGYSYAADAAHTEGVLGIIGPNREAMFNATLAPDNGLITLTPWVLLAVVGGYYALRDREARERIGAEAITCAAIALVYVLFVGSLVPEFGRAGWSVGPRYIAVAMPFFGWLAAAGFAAIDRNEIARGASQALVWVGVIVFVTAAATFPHWPTPNFTNPIHEVALRLIANGNAPHSLGTAVGLPGIAAMLPLLLGVAAVAGWWMAGRDRRRWIVTVIAALVAAGIIAGYGAFPRTGGAAATRGWEFIQDIWQP
jgi:hypothetical protein